MGATVRTKLLWGTLTGVFALGVVTAIAAQKFLPGQNAAASHVAAPTPADDDEAGGQPIDIPVKTIHPKRDPSFIISVQELASVEPYYRADLRARVAGPIKFITKDIGGRVTKGPWWKCGARVAPWSHTSWGMPSVSSTAPITIQRCAPAGSTCLRC